MTRAHDTQRELLAIAQEAVELLAARHGDGLVSAVLYGSVARREAGPGSDIDLLLVFRELPQRRGDRFRIFHDVLLALQARIDELFVEGIAFDWSPLLLTVDEARQHSPLYLDMTLEARLLLDRSGFFAGVLDGMRARLRELGSRRVTMADGSHCWVLTPDVRPAAEVEL